MTLGTITAEKDCNEEYGADDQLQENSDELFFSHPDYKTVRLCEEPKAHDYWESGLTVESLEALRLGSWDHSHSMCFHCKNKGHLKANCPDRQLANRKPWERAWKARKEKQRQNTGGGMSKDPLRV